MQSMEAFLAHRLWELTSLVVAIVRGAQSQIKVNSNCGYPLQTRRCRVYTTIERNTVLQSRVQKWK